MRLWLVRHAALLQPGGLCYGASDIPADPRQTEAAALRLAHELPANMRARCSPLQRCRTLADRLQALRPDLTITSDVRLAEMDFGAWEGQAWDAIGEPALSAWTGDFAAHRPGGGESVRQLMRRVADALQDFTTPTATHGVWITHAGVIKAAQLLAGGQRHVARADEWPRDSVAFGAWTVLNVPTGGTATAVPA